MKTYKSKTPQILTLTIVLLLPHIGSAAAYVIVNNQSGKPALVKLVGPKTSSISLPDRKKEIVAVPPGQYYIKARYGTPQEYSYYTSPRFSVEREKDVTIALYKTPSANLDLKTISEAEFASDTTIQEPALPITATSNQQESPNYRSIPVLELPKTKPIPVLELPNVKPIPVLELPKTKTIPILELPKTAALHPEKHPTEVKQDHAIKAGKARDSFVRVDQLMKQGNLDEALRLARDSIQQSPNDVNSWLALGTASAAKGQFREAAAALNRAAEQTREAKVTIGGATLSGLDEGFAITARIFAGMAREIENAPSPEIAALVRKGCIFSGTYLEDLTRAKEHFQNALRLAEQGNYDTAAQRYREILKGLEQAQVAKTPLK